jgi:hypothetical protein
MPLIDHDHINRRVIHLHLLQQLRHLRRYTAGRSLRPSSVAPLPSQGRLQRIQLSNPAQHRPPRRPLQTPDAAQPGDLPAHCRHRSPLPGQIASLQNLPNNHLDVVGQPASTAAAVGPAR